MKVTVTTTAQVRVLSKSVNEWNMNGRNGVTYKVGIRCGEDIDKVKVTPELYGSLQVDHDYMLGGTLTVSNGNTSFMFDTVDLNVSDAGTVKK